MQFNNSFLMMVPYLRLAKRWDFNNRNRTSRTLMLPTRWWSGPATTGSPPIPFSFINLNASNTNLLASTDTTYMKHQKEYVSIKRVLEHRWYSHASTCTWSGCITGRPSWCIDLLERLSNQSRPWHCESPLMTDDWEIMFWTTPWSMSTTGMLRSRNFERSRSTVSIESSFWTGKNGAHLYDLVISSTYANSIKSVGNWKLRVFETWAWRIGAYFGGFERLILKD